MFCTYGGCFYEQVQQVCTNCGVCMARYFCGICKLFDDDVSSKPWQLALLLPIDLNMAKVL